jgi:hypothetical protein
MIKPEHILHFKIDRDRLLAHQQLMPPGYATKPLDVQFSAIGDTVIGKLMDVDPVMFGVQLEAARQHGVSYMMEDERRRIIGISAATSLIKDDDIVNKNLIVPRRWLHKDSALWKHLIVAVFTNIDAVNVAGWTDTYMLYKAGRNNEQMPYTFHSKLSVVTLPCGELTPMSVLMDRISAQSVCV